jgi:hypothetical protein
MKIKNNYLIFGIILIVIIGILLLKINEDDWIKDKRGVWIKHGNPVEISEEVEEQQQAIDCAYILFNNFSREINSQCLGTCENYSVDIVHVPRTEEDSLISNQCWDYIDGTTNNLIEFNKEGDIVRIF